MKNVLQCPKCAIRFVTVAELNDHLSRDHAAFRAAATNVADDLLAACHCHHAGHEHKKNVRRHHAA